MKIKLFKQAVKQTTLAAPRSQALLTIHQPDKGKPSEVVMLITAFDKSDIPSMIAHLCMSPEEAKALGKVMLELARVAEAG